MFLYIIRRIGLMIPVVLGVLIIVFTVSRMSGDPIAMILGAEATPEQYEEEREKRGLNDPLPVQFYNYVKGIVTEFDLGTSYVSNRNVGTEVLERLPISLGLSLISLILALIVGVLFGVICATHQNGKLDYAVTLIALICCSLPGFWVALMMILLFCVALGWLPPTGLETWKHWILPSFALALAPIASITRTTRSSMLEVIRQDYICTAKSKGISRWKIIFKHALKNAMFPIITVFGTMASVSVGGAVVIETVFSIPGIGSYLALAITNKDFPVIQGTVLVLSFLVCAINLIVDIAYGFADPRIRAKYTRSKKKEKEKKVAVAQEVA